METVKTWCVKIAGLLILSVICDGILPSGDVKKYVRILMGLILTICVCSPLAFELKDEFLIEDTREKSFYDIEKMEEKERENVLRLYKANLAKKMHEDLTEVIEGCEFEFQIEVETRDMDDFGKLKGVIVTVITENEELQVNGLIEKLIVEKYGVSEKNIAIAYRGK